MKSKTRRKNTTTSNANPKQPFKLDRITHSSVLLDSLIFNQIYFFFISRLNKILNFDFVMKKKY